MGLLKSLKTRRKLASLNSEDSQARRKAAERLGALGDPTCVAPLMDSLLDRDAGVRGAAAEALGKLKDVRAVTSLVCRLADWSSNVREQALLALNSIDQTWPSSDAARNAVPNLMAALEDSDPEIKRLSAIILGKIGDRRSTGPLLTCLNSDITSVRDAALQALNQSDPNWQKGSDAQESIHALIISLTNANSSSREAALRSLHAIDPAWQKSETALKLTDACIQMLSGKEASTRSEAVQLLENLQWKPQTPEEQVIYLTEKGDWEQLTQLGKPAIDYMVDLMGLGDKQTQRMLASGLAAVGSPEAKQALLKMLLQGKSYSRQRLSCDALDQIDTGWRKSHQVRDEMIPTLLLNLRSEDESLVQQSASALGLIADRGVTPTLLEGLADKNWGYVQGCIQTLGYLRDDEAVQPLNEMLTSTGASILIYTILNALGNIGSPPAQQVLLDIVKSGSTYCKDARDILNRGKPYEQEHVLCPVCQTYLGIREALVSERYVKNEESGGDVYLPGLAGDLWYKCPGCEDQVLIN